MAPLNQGAIHNRRRSSKSRRQPKDAAEAAAAVSAAAYEQRRRLASYDGVDDDEYDDAGAQMQRRHLNAAAAAGNYDVEFARRTGNENVAAMRSVGRSASAGQRGNFITTSGWWKREKRKRKVSLSFAFFKVN